MSSTTYQLDEVYSFKSGLSKPRSEFGSGYPFLGFKRVFYNFFIQGGLKELVQTTKREQEACSVKRGDVFLTRTSETFDELAMSAVALQDYPKATFNGFTKRLRPNKSINVDPVYAGYYFRSRNFRARVNAMATMSTRASLNNEILSKLTIDLPPIDEQVVIGKKLKVLDDKIALNRRANATLEAMAQALFKSWFVDFDPVIDNALAAGRALPEALQARAARRQAVLDSGQYPQLDAEIKGLFPDAFVWSEELGKFVPEGWEVKAIGEVCLKVQNGSTPKRSEPSYWDDGSIPWLTSGEVRNSLINKTSQFISEAGLKNSSAKINPAGSTVVAMYGATAGEVALLGIQTTTNQAVCALHPKPGARLFNHLSLSTKVEELAGKARGSAQQNISKGIIESFKVVSPSLKMLSLFEDQCSKLFAYRFQNAQQSSSLASVRDVLLGELIG